MAGTTSIKDNDGREEILVAIDDVTDARRDSDGPEGTHIFLRNGWQINCRMDAAKWEEFKSLFTLSRAAYIPNALPITTSWPVYTPPGGQGTPQNPGGNW